MACSKSSKAARPDSAHVLLLSWLLPGVSALEIDHHAVNMLLLPQLPR
jgi:hypothetical protein